MKRLVYSLLDPRGGITPAEGSLVELIEAIPYLLAFDTIPPLALLNGVLESGDEQAGMSGGCRWEPFALTAGDYDGVCAELAAKGYHVVVAPDWVQTRTDWAVYLDEVWNGVPAGEMLGYHRDLERLELAWRQLEAEGKEAEAMGLKEQAMELSLEMSAKRGSYGWKDDWKRARE